MLNILQVEYCRTAGIDHERDCERIIDRCEIGDRLFDTILEHLKILAPQVRNELPVTADHQHRRSDQRRDHPDYLDWDDLLSTDHLSKHADGPIGEQPGHRKAAL